MTTVFVTGPEKVAREIALFVTAVIPEDDYLAPTLIEVLERYIELMKTGKAGDCGGERLILRPGVEMLVAISPEHAESGVCRIPYLGGYESPGPKEWLHLLKTSNGAVFDPEK